MRHEVLAVDMNGVTDKIAELAEISAVDKSGISIKPRRNVLVDGIEFKFPRASLGKNLVGRTGLVGSVEELGFAGDGLGIHLPVLVDLDLGVNAPHAVGSDGTFRQRAKTVGRGVQLAVSVNESHAGAFADLAVEAKDAKVGIVPGERIGLDDTLARRAVVGQKCSDGPWFNFGGEPGGVERINNSPCEGQIQGRLEVAGVFLEKRPLLREEDLKTLVDCNLRIVRLDLTKIGIEGGVQHQAVFDHDLGIQSRFGRKMLSCKTLTCWIASIQRTKSAERSIGNELHVPSRRDSVEPGDVRFVNEPALFLAAVSGVVGAFAVARNHPGEKNPPGVRAGGTEAHGFEGNLKPDHVAAVQNLCLRMPNGVKRLVKSPVFSEDGVLLDAVRIGEEGVGMAVVKERIPEKAHVVVVSS